MSNALAKYGETEGVVPRGHFRQGDEAEVETFAQFLDMKASGAAATAAAPALTAGLGPAF